MIDGPRIAARNGRATSLVVFLHGYGADGNDLIDIGRAWATGLPGAAFAAPHAPESCDESPMGRQWFSLAEGIDPRRLAAGVEAARADLDAFLDADLASLGLGDDRLVLVGFSQGTMMALHVGLLRARPLAGIVGYSGLVASPASLASAVHRPPVLLVHGSEDPVIPAEALFAAVQVLGTAGLPVEWHLRPGLAHGIDQDGIDLGLAFAHCVLGDDG